MEPDGEGAQQQPIIGFSTLREIQRKEREFTPLQQLPSDFYFQVALYFSGVNKSIKELLERRNENEFAGKVLHQRETESENAKSVVKDIFSRRLRKILILAHETVFTKAVVDTLVFTSEEREIFDSLAKRLSEFNGKVYSNLISSSVSSARAGFARVEFVEDCPAFVGLDLRNYGPFSAGAVAEIPEKNAELLVSSGKSRKV
ncbi:MAG: hypothetical protein V1820_03370 [archaeon]